MINLKKGFKIFTLAAITCLLGGYLYTSANAQRGPQGGGPGGFDPEQMEKVWKVQAASVAAAIGLDGETGKKLSEAYLGSRKDLQEKMIAARESGAGREGWREMREEAIEGLETSLGSFLDEDQAKKAKEYIGGFSLRSDIGAGVLSRLLEDADKLHSAVATVVKHESANPPGSRIGGGGPPPDQGERAQRNEELYKELGSVLSAEQLEEFKEAYQQWGGRGPRGGGPRPQ